MLIPHSTLSLTWSDGRVSLYCGELEDRLAVDTFAGSGSTLLAAQALGLRAIGFEKSPENCAIAAKRLDAQAAGQALFHHVPNLP